MPENMMEEFDCWLIRLLKFIVTGILLVLYLLFVGQWISPEPQHSITRLSEAERQRISGGRQRNQGISTGIIEDGEHYYYRDGKKYKL